MSQRTLSVKHARNIQIFLSDFKGSVQILQRIVLQLANTGAF